MLLCNFDRGAGEVLLFPGLYLPPNIFLLRAAGEAWLREAQRRGKDYNLQAQKALYLMGIDPI